MELKHIVVAVDDSSVGRHALGEAIALAASAGARVTAVTAIAARPLAAPSAALSAARAAREHALPPALADLDARVRAAEPRRLGVSVTTDVTYGVPGIEICRFAEAQNADLLILGRKRRSQAERLLIGDTADAVARRSRVPCLFVPGDASVGAPVLASVDCGPRAARVVRAAWEFSAALGWPLRLLSVEPESEHGPDDLGDLLATERRQRLADTLRTAAPEAAADAVELIVRRGDAAGEVLRTTEQGGAGVLVVGYRRGGPPGVAELGSVARRLAHGAACPVLTIPL
jgi:nucleotide-binding universal stress UspA family protein